MDRRFLVTACIVAILILISLVLLTRPITGTWVCTDRLTEHEMLVDEVTTINLRPDGTVYLRSYGDYLGRYEINGGSGRWEPAGTEKYRVAIMEGIEISCYLMGNCTYSKRVPFTFSINHDLIQDTISYDPAAAPEFSSIRPFVRSIVADCSDGCPGS
jgi:hypothetical protein